MTREIYAHLAAEIFFLTGAAQFRVKFPYEQNLR
jgi:hypothetical protein